MKNFFEQDIRNGSINTEDFRKDLIDSPLDWQKRGLQETASGYGARLTTNWKIRYQGKDYRVYCTCFSNSGSCWFKAKGKKIFVN